MSYPTRDTNETLTPDAVPGQSWRQRWRVGLIWRLLVVAGAAATALTGAPGLVSGTLLLVGLLLAVERLARLRGHGWLDVLLVSVGGELAALVLVGLVLGATPIGLRATTWTVAIVAVSLMALIVAALAPAPPATRPSRGAAGQVLRVGPWLAAGLAVVAVAVTVSTRSVETAERLPVEMSIGQVDGTRVQVVVRSSEKVGPLELRTTGTGSEISYPLITVKPGQATTTTLALPASGRATITLNYPDQTQPLRTLILDR